MLRFSECIIKGRCSRKVTQLVWRVCSAGLFSLRWLKKCLMWYSAGSQNPLEPDGLPAGSDPSCLLQVKRTYSQGTYRAGAMRQVSLVGAVDEEVGDYFPEFIRMLEDSPFLVVSSLISVRLHINTDVSTSVLCRCVMLCNLKFFVLCSCRELCPGERSPVCGCRAQETATTAPSCGSDQENRWSPWQTCPSRPSKGKGVQSSQAPDVHHGICP